MPAPFVIDEKVLAGLSAVERREELARIAEFKARLDQNPLWGYVPHEGERGRLVREARARGEEPVLTGREERGQVAFHEIDRYIGAYVAGNRSGKTEGGLVDDLIQTLDVEFLPPWLACYKRFEGEFMCRVVGQDLNRWLGRAVVPKLRSLIPPAALWKGSFDRAYDPRERKLQFENGSIWDFLTHDMEVDAFASVDLDRVHFDEEPKGELGRLQYEESLGRLVDRDGDVRWTLTPLLGLTLAFAELTDSEGNPRDDEECKVVRGSMDDNPHISEKGRDRYLKRFAKDPLKLEARRHGRWVHFEGLIYPDFSRDRHRCPESAVPRDEAGVPRVPVYMGIDPGIGEKHPTGLVLAWHDVDDVLEVFFSRRLHGMDVAQIVDYGNTVCDSFDVKIPAHRRIIDPAARSRNVQTGKSLESAFRKHGWHVTLGQNSRATGFNAVIERLRSDRIRFQPMCFESEEDGGIGSLAWEFEKYRWKGRRTRSEDAPPAEPIKVDDDQLDALRYVVMALPRRRSKEEPDEDQVRAPVRAFRRHVRHLASRQGRKARVGGHFPA